MATVLGLTAVGLTALPVAAAPVTVEYPSATCPDTGDEGLQQCIDSVDPGSTVILTTEIIGEAAAIDKSLTLRAVDRTLQPVLVGVAITSPSSGGTAKVVVQDIRFSLAVFVNLSTGSGHSVIIRRVEVGKGALEPLGMRLESSVPASITLENSFIRSDQDDQQDVLNLVASDPDGRVNFRVVGNRITARGDTESASGIDLSMEGEGSVRAAIYNNVIFDVATCNCGVASGISIVPDPEFRADINVVGNVIERSGESGIYHRNGLTTGRLSLDVFNNIISHNGQSGIRLDSGNAGTLVFRGGFNDFFANGSPNIFDGKSAGPGNLAVAPLFVNPAANDFRLRSNSPLINKGITCSPGGIANPDAAGRHRLNGPTVDMGAFESGSAAINGVVRVGTGGEDTLVGTAGRDILCGYGAKDILSGAAGPDYIDGGAGPDRATGGLGVDRVLGNEGDDLLCMRDGAGGEVADGGPGNDKAQTDAGDIRIAIEQSGPC